MHSIKSDNRETYTIIREGKTDFLNTLKFSFTVSVTLQFICCPLTSGYLIGAVIFLPNDFISFAGYIQYITMSTVKHQAVQALRANFLHSLLTVITACVFILCCKGWPM